MYIDAIMAKPSSKHTVIDKKLIKSAQLSNNWDKIAIFAINCEYEKAYRLVLSKGSDDLYFIRSIST